MGMEQQRALTCHGNDSLSLSLRFILFSFAHIFPPVCAALFIRGSNFNLYIFMLLPLMLFTIFLVLFESHQHSINTV